MSIVITAYFAFGIGFYLALAMSNIKSFMDATPADLIRGILVGLIFWPIGLVIQLYVKLMESK